MFVFRLRDSVSKTLCSKKYTLNGFNYHLSDVNVANFNKIHRPASRSRLY